MLLLVGCMTATTYREKGDLPPDTQFFKSSEAFSATVTRYWVYSLADVRLSSTEYDVGRYSVEQLENGGNLIGKPATIIGTYHGFYVAELPGFGYLFAPEFDVRDQAEAAKQQTEFEKNNEALTKLFDQKQSVSQSNDVLASYVEMRSPPTQHMPKVGDKLKIEVGPEELTSGGSTMSTANGFSFAGDPIYSEPAGFENPLPYRYVGADLFVAEAFAGYRALGYPFALEFTVYGTVIEDSSFPLVRVDYLTLPGPGSVVTVQVENRDMTQEEFMKIAGGQ
jgi:hypothetical protein